MPLVRLVREAHRLLQEAGGDERTEEELTESFERMVRPSLAYCEEVGNIFSGTVYAGLAALLDSTASPPPGVRIGLYSYGSGSCAEFYSGVVGPAARETVRGRGIAAHLAERRGLTLEEYEKTVLDREASVGRSHFRPDPGLPAGLYSEAYDGRHRLVLARVENHYRHYVWS
jgi:polyketide biosynthesis 3-hydroxy-3-methylglutaryl-CoA synthase-like enzyme PksG